MWEAKTIMLGFFTLVRWRNDSHFDSLHLSPVKKETQTGHYPLLAPTNDMREDVGLLTVRHERRTNGGMVRVACGSIENSQILSC